jgi:hypothetical protein
VHRAVLLTVGLLGVALAGAACGADAADGGIEATEAMMLETCAPGADPREVELCRCAWDALVADLDADAIAELDRDVRDDPANVPPALQEAVLGCAFALVAPPPTKPVSTSSTSTTRVP